MSEANKIGFENKFQSAANIVEPILQAKFKENGNCALPNPDHIARMVNRVREKLRLKNPSNLMLKIKKDCLPDGFLLTNVKVGRRRHLIFGTEKQVEQMRKSKRWYFDGTFRLVDKPFVQLFFFMG